MSEIKLEILQKIKSSSKILVSCHRNPDADSIGSSLALGAFAESLGKEVKIISPSEINSNFYYMDGAREIEHIEIDKMDLGSYDILILPDIASWGRVLGSDSPEKLPEIETIVIDNHESNTGFGDINLLNYETSSVAEMVYRLLMEWGFEIDLPVATYLLSGIVGDTGVFQYEVYDETLSITQDLRKRGVDYEKVILNLFGSYSLELVKFWGLVIDKLVIHEAGFVYAAISHEEYAPFEHMTGARETAANLIVSRIEGSLFGIIIVEERKGAVTVSFRAREKIDVAVLAMKLGGGGHPGAAGAHIQGEEFDTVVERVLGEAQEYVEKNKG